MLTSKVVRLGLVLPWLILYGYLAYRAAKARPGATLRDRVVKMLGDREPAVYLDSAKLIVLIAWLWNSPNPVVLKETLSRNIPIASPIGIFKAVSLASMPLWTVDVATWAFRVGLVLAALGFATRIGTAVAALCHVYLWSLSYSFGYSVHNHMVPMALLAFAFCPDPSPHIGKYFKAWREKKPLTEVASYPAYSVEAVRFAVMTVYVQAGLEKMLQSGAQYFNGVTIQTHFLWGLELITPAANWPLWLLGAIGFAVCFWESSYGLVHFFPKSRLPLILTAFIFHEIVRYGISINPFSFLEAGILFFAPPYELALLFRGKSAPRTRAAEGEKVNPKWGFVAAAAVLCAVQWLPFFTRKGEYPILSFSLFSGSYQGGETQPRFAKVSARKRPDGAFRQVDEVKELAMHNVAFSEFIVSRFGPFYFEKLSLPGYAKQEHLVDRREEHCQWLLDQVRRYAGMADADELVIDLNYYIVGDTSARTARIYECKR
ncbi:MAG: HTTM domain-containing protein [Polyangiaceae bacterium]|nr:HTTM domain-containing protein [Polyangiaceae bacterium]